MDASADKDIRAGMLLARTRYKSTRETREGRKIMKKAEYEMLRSLIGDELMEKADAEAILNAHDECNYAMRKIGFRDRLAEWAKEVRQWIGSSINAQSAGDVTNEVIEQMFGATYYFTDNILSYTCSREVDGKDSEFDVWSSWLDPAWDMYCEDKAPYDFVQKIARNDLHLCYTFPEDQMLELFDQMDFLNVYLEKLDNGEETWYNGHILVPNTYEDAESLYDQMPELQSVEIPEGAVTSFIWNDGREVLVYAFKDGNGFLVVGQRKDESMHWGWKRCLKMDNHERELRMLGVRPAFEDSNQKPPTPTYVLTYKPSDGDEYVYKYPLALLPGKSMSDIDIEQVAYTIAAWTPSAERLLGRIYSVGYDKNNWGLKQI